MACSHQYTVNYVVDVFRYFCSSIISKLSASVPDIEDSLKQLLVLMGKTNQILHGGKLPWQ
ncbi:hypothetical protein F9B74_07200 [Pelistega sp. NLN82]|uniref:Uncharacterized protein n=1 Tax=Pelistega ratti TaxID=2652177 RepID=A0A6L9Y8A5_9BURK|nr:hypothetical protein [Pelistega ratti]NEN76107.1 hypothetical protein [Pelistega ratti]